MHMTDNDPMKLEKHYTCWIERRWNIPNKSFPKAGYKALSVQCRYTYVMSSNYIIRWHNVGVAALDTKSLVASLGKGFVRYIPSPFYPASVMLFQLHGGIVSHMHVLATPFSTVHSTKYLDPYHWSHIRFSCLLLRQWCRDVASGIDRHPDKTEIDIRLQIQGNRNLVPVLFREVFSHPYISFFHLLVNGFSVTCFRTFF